MDNKLVITSINVDAFKATGHVLPSTYILELTQEQIDFLDKIENRGETIDRVSIGKTVELPNNT